MENSLNYIHGLYRKGTKPCLDRIALLLEKLGNPHKKLKFVHVAGTNGKGSTASMTASILTHSGYKAGLFTSPYIYRFNERIQIDGKQIPDEDVIRLTAKVRALAETMPEPPTEFDFVTAMAMEFFLEQGCDIVVLEVGVGGALDATNIIPAPQVAVVTNIGLDHTDLLGNTLAEIATVKAGIVKEGCRAVFYPGDESVEAVYHTVCAEKNVTYTIADFSGIRLTHHDLEGQIFDYADHKGVQLPLLGAHQLCNAAVVLNVARQLQEIGWDKITADTIRKGIREVSWPGRFEIVGRAPLFIIDGGHNPQCIQALVENIKDYLANKKIIVVAGVLADKDYGEMFRPVMEFTQEFVCITPDNPRRMMAADLAEHLRKAGAKATPCETVKDGVALAKKLAGEDGVVLSFGSLYSIGDVRAAADN